MADQIALFKEQATNLLEKLKTEEATLKDRLATVQTEIKGVEKYLEATGDAKPKRRRRKSAEEKEPAKADS